MPFTDNNASSLLFKTKRNRVIKSTLICSVALAGIAITNPPAMATVKADAAPQIETPATNWIATKPVDIHVDNNQKTYTLNRGDTLWAVAQATNTDVNRLAQLNNINLEAGDQYHLAVGLTIKLTADAQTDNNRNNNAINNTNTAAQNSTTTNNNNTAQTTSTANSSPQNTSKAAANNQTANGNSNAGNTRNAGSGTNANTTENGQVAPSKSQISKPANVIHNKSGKTTSGKTKSQPAISQSGILNGGSISSQTPSSSTNKTPNNNNSNTASSKTNNSSSASTSSGNKAKSTSNAGPGPVNINRGTNSSSSNSNSSSNNNNAGSNSSNNKPSKSSSSSSSNNDSQTADNDPSYTQTTPLNDTDLAKVVALEKQINNLQIQADTVADNLQFYPDFIKAVKNIKNTNPLDDDTPQDRIDKIAYQDTYYQKTVDGYSDMRDEQAQLTTIKAQLPVDAQTITNLQNRLAKPNITDAEKQTLNTDLHNAKATAIKDQETYQTLQADINQASETVAEYKALLARNADMTAALKGNGQANKLVAQYQKYINDNQNTEASLKTQIANIENQLKAYGVTVNFPLN